MPPLLQRLDERNVVALQQNLAYSWLSVRDSLICTAANFRGVHTEFSPAAIGSVLWVGVVLCALLDLHRIVDDQVHELVEATNLSLDTHTQLLIEPDLHCGVLLQEFEDEVDWRQKDLVAASSLTVRHFCGFAVVLMWKQEFLRFGIGVMSRASGVVGGEIVCSGTLRCAQHMLELRGQKFARLPPSTDVFRVQPLDLLI